MRIMAMQRRLRRAAMLVLAALALPGAAEAAQTVRVGTPAAGSYIFSLLDVGAKSGIFAKHGIELKRIDFGGGGKLAQGMTAGSIDMALSGSTDLVFIAKGMPAKAVAMVLAAPIDLAIIARTDGEITRPEQLKGKTIGVTTATSLTAWLALDFARRQGWGSDGVRLAPIGGVASELAGLRAKNVDAFVGPTEAGYELEAKHIAFPLVTFGYLHDFITHILYARDSLIAAHPATVRNFVAAWFDTVKFVRANKAAALRLSMPVTKLPADIAAKTYDIQMPYLSSSGRFASKSLTAVAQSFVALHLLDKTPPLGSLYTDKFLP